MASDDDSRIPLINPSTSPGSANARYTDSLPLTTINMTPGPISSDNGQGLRQRSKKKIIPMKNIFMFDMNDRVDSGKKKLVYL